MGLGIVGSLPTSVSKLDALEELNKRFGGMTSLYQMILSNNDFTFIHEDCFAGLPSWYISTSMIAPSSTIQLGG